MAIRINRNEVGLHDNALDTKCTQSGVDEREFKECEMTLCHESEIQTYKELEDGFEEYLAYEKGVLHRLISSFLQEFFTL